MAATQVRVGYQNSTGQLSIVVVPDQDSQLNYPAFSPQGYTCVNLSVTTYQGLSQLGIMQTTVAAITLLNPTVGALLAAIIASLT